MIRVGRACSRTSRPAPPALAPPVSSDSGDRSSRVSSTSATCAPRAPRSWHGATPGTRPAAAHAAACTPSLYRPPNTARAGCSTASQRLRLPPQPRDTAHAQHTRDARAHLVAGGDAGAVLQDGHRARKPAQRVHQARAQRVAPGPHTALPRGRSSARAGRRARAPRARACWVTVKYTRHCAHRMSCNIAL